MQEMIDCLTEEITRYWSLSEIGEEELRDGYREKAEVLSRVREFLEAARGWTA